ncbi:hypothetical protein HETIRDRAFT_432539 [Heterobasidion irregulare TC 32-1]|uniref:RRM domain-containing protein n=1 Tax=Heterobasidion irregulare (strain TC 32-1) TaxID=747525 RepID=W4KJI0_HETIT|nr:uncharacterized protein HETIRDRAFT_432539 [Heterobasidion irregulare TC 32-1]ETW86007.1 hypothetical protein HETIRDRAFT_432539 [Heterobasidion irregulare TC 32-1]
MSLNLFKRKISSKHMKLNGLPRTALPSDIRRMLVKYNITENFGDIQLDYGRFIPTGSAYLTFTAQSALHRAFIELRNASHMGFPITASRTPVPIGPPPRSRGDRGRLEASQRGVISGDGYRAGITETGKSVVVWGMPGKMTTDTMRLFLRGYKLAPGEGQITKLDSIGTQLTSRHFVRLNSMSEAYRLVRNVHMTFFEPLVWGDRYIIRARVVH